MPAAFPVLLGALVPVRIAGLLGSSRLGTEPLHSKRDAAPILLWSRPVSLRARPLQETEPGHSGGRAPLHHAMSRGRRPAEAEEPLGLLHDRGADGTGELLERLQRQRRLAPRSWRRPSGSSASAGRR